MIAAGCNIQLDSGPSPTLTIAPPENPYQSTTKTPVPETPTLPPPTVEPIIATPTPFTHIVQPDETLYGIAVKYDVSLDRLVSVNPGLDSRLLTVGTEIIIPLAEEEYRPPTPTPYALAMEESVCYPTADQGLYCYALVENNQEFSVENISIAFNIFNAEQELVKSQIGFPPLNTLFPGQSIPVGALIPNVQANQNQISTTLLSAYPSNLQDPLVVITEYNLEYSQGDTIARVSGRFKILHEELLGGETWIVGIGYAQGKPVALRKWISNTDREQSDPFTFDFLLYSLGPEIEQIELFSELH